LGGITTSTLRSLAKATATAIGLVG
jgi:hypothetical protein